MIDYSKAFDDQTREEAEAFANLCLSGKRWYGNGLLITIDACFDSIGLNYFTVVVPKVRCFYENFFVKRHITTMESFLGNRDRQGLFRIIDNSRAWNAVREISRYVVFNKKDGEDDFSVLRRWASNADPNNMDDPIRNIKGIGINTFQYLRMQVGVDTVMPDKVIRKWLVENGFKARDEFDTIEKIEEIADANGISRIALCWAIWIKKSGEAGKVPIL